LIRLVYVDFIILAVSILILTISQEVEIGYLFVHGIMSESEEKFWSKH